MRIDKFEFRADDHAQTSRNLLLEGLRLAFISQKAAYYSERGALVQDGKLVHPVRLSLYWYKRDTNPSIFPFLAPASPDIIEPLVREWLSKAEYGREPDHDGDNEKGWFIYSQDQAEYDAAAICHIEPAWIEYGK